MNEPINEIDELLKLWQRDCQLRMLQEDFDRDYAARQREKRDALRQSDLERACGCCLPEDEPYNYE